MKTKKTPFAIIGTALVAIIVVAVIFIIVKNNQKPNLVTTSESALKEVIEIGEFSTLKYTYNSYTPVMLEGKDEKKDEIKYYVAYKGDVTVGFDFESLSVLEDEDNKTLFVIIPDITINEIHVQEGSLDFIFVKEKYDTDKTFAEAIKACEKDLKAKANENTTLFAYAKESAISMMKAIFAPWEETLPEGYKVEYK